MKPRATMVMSDTAAQIRLQRCKLVQVTGPGKGKEHELGEEMTIGSEKDCDLIINHPTVSHKHFTVVRESESYILRDLGSTNGTFIDDARVKEAYLRPGSVIRAGEVHLRFEPVYERIDLVPSEASHFGSVLGKSYKMRAIFAVLEKVAPTEATILLQGETGSGKGAFARSIHKASARSEGPFVVFDCGAVAPTLVESELFGHERGAFTGAVQTRKGALEEAQGGTLFIDELSDLALDLQPKLLRALEDREFTRIGSNKSTKVSCRIIAATQRDLWQEVQDGKFREDLYFRLAVVTVPIPPLRERREDIAMIVDEFLKDVDSPDYPDYDSLDDELKQRLQSHDWPGNIRELRNTVERIGLVQGDPFVRPGALPGADTNLSQLEAEYELPFKDAKETVVNAFEREYLTRLLKRTEGNIARSAREAQIDRKHLYTLLAKHGLDAK